MEDREYLTLEQIVRCGRYFYTESQIRTFLLSREKNGLDYAIRKAGKKILFIRDLWEKWIESHACKKEQNEL